MKANQSYFYFFFLIDATASKAIEIITPEIRAEMSPKGNQTASFGLMLFLFCMLNFNVLLLYNTFECSCTDIS